MVSKKSKRRRADKAVEEEEEEEEEEGTQNDSPHSAFQSIFSALQSPQGINASVLNRCYLLLNHLSSIPPCTIRKGQGVRLNVFHEETGNDPDKLLMEDVVRISDLLFKELPERFTKCFSSLSEEDDTSALDRWDSFRIVNLLLRCCLVLLTLPGIHPEYLFDKGQVILVILRQLRSAKLEVDNGIRFEGSISSTCGYVDAGYASCSTEDFVASLHLLDPSSSSFHFVSVMHEVILDELLMHGQLRSFLKLIDSFVPTSSMLCVSRSGFGDVGILLEVIFSHFCLAFSEKQNLEVFFNRLFWVETQKFRLSSRLSEVSPVAATVLLLNPIILSAPKFIQAHIIAFVSEAINISLGSESLKPDCRLMNCYLSILEKSVVLYTKNIHNMQSDSSENFIKSAEGDEFQPSFEAFILPDTRNKINCLIAKLDDSQDSYLSNIAIKTKTGIVNSAISFIKECQEFVFDKSFQDEIFSILSRIVTEASDRLEYAASNASVQNLCVLAAVLRLMNTALLRVVSYMRYSGDPNHPMCSSDNHFCKEYDILSNTIGCFGSSGVPIQRFLCSMMKTSSPRHKNSKMMFLHFSGLLSQSLSTGLDFLIKSSLSVMMTLMNLFVFEEGNLDVFCQLYASSSEPVPSGLTSVSINETSTSNSYSREVASKFMRTRTLYSRSCKTNCLEKYQCRRSPNPGAASPPDITDAAVAVEEQTEETSNGELFLNCILKPGRKVHDFDDLASFIECKPGKDYASWCKNRKKFRMWKGQKMAIVRWKRRKRSWSIAKRKKP